MINPDAATYREAVAAYLLEHRGEWVDGLTLAGLGGAYAWRTRVSECRTKLGLNVVNRLTRENGRIVSEYRIPLEAA